MRKLFQKNTAYNKGEEVQFQNVIFIVKEATIYSPLEKPSHWTVKGSLSAFGSIHLGTLNQEMKDANFHHIEGAVFVKSFSSFVVNGKKARLIAAKGKDTSNKSLLVKAKADTQLAMAENFEQMMEILTAKDARIDFLEKKINLLFDKIQDKPDQKDWLENPISDRKATELKEAKDGIVRSGKGARYEV